MSIDQSTQGTKALLFDDKGRLRMRADLPHRQIVNERGWVSHDGEEIYRNTIQAIRNVLNMAQVSPDNVAGIGISNQRETAIMWDRENGRPADYAVVWQCARASEICQRKKVSAMAEQIRQKTGLRLSPYFTAAKICWLLENVEDSEKKAYGTIDSYLVYRLTKGDVYATDYSNACFGHTDCEGLFTRPVPIHTVMGDSHAALFGQNCRSDGMIKVTYGTGSSIMMNIGHKPILSNNGLVTSLAWGLEGKPEYVLEGNLNYTGAVISWLKDNVDIIQDVTETEALADAANKSDNLYLIPAFSGLGAPYWDSAARAAFVGMDRTTGRAELVRAALESIAYQITDIIRAMERDSQKDIGILRADGGATGNEYLMQFQSDIAGCEVSVSEMEELSGTGAAFMAGMKMGLWDEKIFDTIKRKRVLPKMTAATREYKYDGYRRAVGRMKTV